MNIIILTGRLTRDNDLRYTKNNSAILNNNIAVKRDFMGINGEYDTDFINITLWGKQAEYLSKYSKKGDEILISGTLETGSYEKNGIRIPTVNIQVNKIKLLNYSKKDNKEEKENKKQEKLSDDVFAEFGNSIEISDEDIAF